jgi:hypothetical protein
MKYSKAFQNIDHAKVTGILGPRYPSIVVIIVRNCDHTTRLKIQVPLIKLSKIGAKTLQKLPHI